MWDLHFCHGFRLQEGSAIYTFFFIWFIIIYILSRHWKTPQKLQRVGALTGIVSTTFASKKTLPGIILGSCKISGLDLY